MTIYNYSKGSAVDEIEFQKVTGGSYRAYLHASPTANEETLSDISMALAKRGWQTIPFNKGSKHTLEVRGFDLQSQLKHELQKNNWINGSPTKIEDKKEPFKFTDTVKKRSLFLSGVANLIGDLSFVKYGSKSKSSLDVMAGAAYTSGTLSSFLFARKDMADLHVKELSDRMAQYMASQNIDIPDNCSISSITKDKHKGIIKSADDLFRRYPSEMMNSFYAIAGAFIASAAIKNKVYGTPSKNAVDEILTKSIAAFRKTSPGLTHNAYRQMATAKVQKQMKFSGKLDAGLGLTTLASGIFGTLVQEEARDPDTPRKHGLEGIWEWVKERPLAITGAGYMVSTLSHATSTVSDWKHAGNEARKSVAWRGVFVATNIVAEILIAISSKGHGKGVIGDESVKDTAISLAGEMISKQPPAQHEQLIDYLSGFLGRDDVLAMKDSTVKDRLREQVALAENNPWAKCKQPRSPAINATNPMEKRPFPTKTPENWQVSVRNSQNHASPAAFI